MSLVEKQDRVKAFSKIFDDLCKISKTARKYKSRINKALKSGEFTIEVYAIYLQIETEMENED